MCFNITVKVKLCLCIIKHHVMKAYGGVEIALQSLGLTIGIGEWSASCPSCFSLRGKTL